LAEKVIPRVRFKRGEKIFNEGDLGDKAYLIESGQVAIVKQSPQGPVIVATIGVRAIFGEMALIDGSRRMATVVAAEDTTLIIINAKQMAQKLSGMHQSLRFAFENMVDYVRQTLPFDARKKTGQTAETAQDTRIRKILPPPLVLEKIRWADPILKALFDMMCDYTRRRLPPAAPAAAPAVPAAPPPPRPAPGGLEY
jgi:CRP-like cAMP-binding protein